MPITGCGMVKEAQPAMVERSNRLACRGILTCMRSSATAVPEARADQLDGMCSGDSVTEMDDVLYTMPGSE